jgi:hypothetical protein
MNSRLLASVALVASCLWQGGCSTMRIPAMTPNMTAATAIPPADPALDHFIARIPVEQAQTATVARAMTHISLGNARVHAGRELCGGTSLRQGQVTEIYGPLPVLGLATQGGKAAWYYRISQRPGLYGCNNHTSASLYQAMRDELPDWISIEPADPDLQQLGMLGEPAH